MSLDKLAVIFIIIVLPISIVLSTYTNMQTKTLELQLSYDTKLNNSTADAIKAFQLNAFNETTSSLATSKMRDINAAANAFFTSLSANFDMQGYSKEDLQDFVPALVFTMYDGYYMYSKYINTITDEDYVSVEDAEALGIKPSTYQNDENGSNPLYGLKPFVSYSCGYKNYPQNGDSFVISYTLDNCITIQGIINGTWVNDSGYLIDTNKFTLINDENKTLSYRGVEIGPEACLQEYLGTTLYKYHKINGVKYYYDEQHKDSTGNPDPKWFRVLNGTIIYDNSRSFDLDYDYSAFNYYRDAYAFTQRITKSNSERDIDGNSCYGLAGLKVSDCDNVENLSQSNKNNTIFDIDGIETPSSNFNEHRLAVIRYTIEKNLSIAIKNYNHYSPTVSADFQMPELKETEWDKIMNNVTLISFLQGMPIGGKIYNGCSVIANNVNDEVITEESIYIADKQMEKTYYKPTYKKFSEVAFTDDEPIGVFNIDLQRRSIEDPNSVQDDYYFPKLYYADYESVVGSSENVNLYAEKTDDEYKYAYDGNIYKYLEENANKNVAKAYFTALGRERQSTYKPLQDYETILINSQIMNLALGDVNGDGVVDSNDLTLLSKYLAGSRVLNNAQKKAADINLNGVIDAKDMAALKRYLADPIAYPIT